LFDKIGNFVGISSDTMNVGDVNFANASGIRKVYEQANNYTEGDIVKARAAHPEIDRKIFDDIIKYRKEHLPELTKGLANINEFKVVKSPLGDGQLEGAQLSDNYRNEATLMAHEKFNKKVWEDVRSKHSGSEKDVDAAFCAVDAEINSSMARSSGMSGVKTGGVIGLVVGLVGAALLFGGGGGMSWIPILLMAVAGLFLGNKVSDALSAPKTPAYRSKSENAQTVGQEKKIEGETTAKGTAQNQGTDQIDEKSVSLGAGEPPVKIYGKSVLVKKGYTDENGNVYAPVYEATELDAKPKSNQVVVTDAKPRPNAVLGSAPAPEVKVENLEGSPPAKKEKSDSVTLLGGEIFTKDGVTPAPVPADTGLTDAAKKAADKEVAKKLFSTSYTEADGTNVTLEYKNEYNPRSLAVLKSAPTPEVEVSNLVGSNPAKVKNYNAVEATPSSIGTLSSPPPVSGTQPTERLPVQR
jgi:hypothetical protein